MEKILRLILVLFLLSTTYSLMILTPIVYNKKDGSISDKCTTQLEQYNKMVDDCKDDKCKDIFTETFVNDVRKACNEGNIEKKLFEQIESSYLFNSVSQFKVDGVSCSMYSVNLGQSLKSRCECMKKIIEYLEEYTKKYDNSILKNSIDDFKAEIKDFC